MERISREFLALEQTTETVPEITRKFNEMALFCPQYAASEDMKMSRYGDMLRTDIREFVTTIKHATLATMIDAARRREVELGIQTRKRKVSAYLIIMGHVKADCPSLKTGGGALKTPVTAPLCITDGRTGQVGTERAHGRAFQLTAEEVQSTLKVVAGTFRVNNVPGIVLFDSGATHSFVSIEFSERLGRKVESLDQPHVVEIVDDRTVTVTRIYRGCTLELNGVSFPIDLIPIAMRQLCVVVGIDWMGAVDAEIRCRLKQIRVRTPSGGELLVQGDTLGWGVALCSAARARRYLQHSGTGYLAYVIDTCNVKKKFGIEDVPIVREFADVFPDDLPGVPPERQVEFRIDLVPGAAPVAKAPYRLDPPEMKELYT
ncbi:hypothetical protein L2E82_45295 [Cichorium intybus]|uniref:Uncharacterized protein n=1 Tax=Cichorium intybus TaxID=13427 RepID=A0ACB8ZSV6_CICIN|nr:hypothetical protein L2E82_45295 [Cichorium intybus]